jgi:hypothetical protein
MNERKIFLRHLYHKHEINLYNISYIQGIKDYSVLNNITYLFLDYFFTKNDEVFVNTAYAFNDGLDPYLSKKDYTLQTFAGDLKSSVKNINSTGRDYLLELWYAKTFDKLSISAGIVDLSGFVDNVEYSQSEQEQFMNSMFVNNPISYLPSYNPGVLVRYEFNDIYTIRTGISTFDPEDGYYYAVELDYGKNNLNFRPIFYITIDSDDNFSGIGISWDYTLNKNGFWGRISKNLNENLHHFSIGYVKKEFLLKNSTAGIAYGIIDGNLKQRAAELYYRKKIVNHFWITGDIQYIEEKKEDLVYGLRTELSY